MPIIQNSAAENAIDLKIKQVSPYIFDRAQVFVSPQTNLEHIALFLIPLRKLFLSGIPVIKENKVVGKIGPKHVLQKVIEFGHPKCMQVVAEDLMVELGGNLYEHSSVGDTLRIFKETKFGFSPIIKDGKLIAAISTRDFLPLIKNLKIDFPVSMISNELIFVDEQISIENTLRIMFEQNLRKIAIKHKGDIRIVDDRSLLDYLFNLEKDKPNILDTKIDSLPKMHISDIPSKMTISEAAEFLMKNDIPCTVHDERIITPMDIVVKVLWSYTQRTDVNETSMLDMPF
jgi:predicted transcriptional regulator